MSHNWGSTSECMEGKGVLDHVVCRRRGMAGKSGVKQMGEQKK